MLSQLFRKLKARNNIYFLTVKTSFEAEILCCLEYHSSSLTYFIDNVLSLYVS